MARVYHLKSIQRIPIEPVQAWNFFASPKNLLTITPPFLHLKMTNELDEEEIYAGQILTYKVKPMLGIPLSWTTLITEVERYQKFIDEQRKGPYSLWHHQHHFKPLAGGVEMTDIVHYSLPLGSLGKLAHLLSVKNQLRKIFTYRYFKINELFGDWPEATSMQLHMS